MRVRHRRGGWGFARRSRVAARPGGSRVRMGQTRPSPPGAVAGEPELHRLLRELVGEAGAQRGGAPITVERRHTMKRFEVYSHPMFGWTAVKNGFTWPGFFFTGLWMFVCRMWIGGVVVCVLGMATPFIAEALGYGLFADEENRAHDDRADLSGDLVRSLCDHRVEGQRVATRDARQARIHAREIGAGAKRRRRSRSSLGRAEDARGGNRLSAGCERRRARRTTRGREQARPQHRRRVRCVRAGHRGPRRRRELGRAAARDGTGKPRTVARTGRSPGDGSRRVRTARARRRRIAPARRADARRAAKRRRARRPPLARDRRRARRA